MKKVYFVGAIAGLIPPVFKFILYLAGSQSIYLGRLTNFEELIVITFAIPVAVYIARKQSPEIDNLSVIKSNGSSDHSEKSKRIFPFITALKTGISTAVIAGVIVCLFTYVHLKYINNSRQETMVTEAINYAAQQKMNAADTEKTIEGVRQYFSPYAQATTALFGIMVWGFFVSVISAVLFKKEK